MSKFRLTVSRITDLNHEANAGIIPDLVDRTLKMGASNYRLLKLLCRRLFDASAYKNLIRIGNGAYGQVYRASLESEKMEVAVKMMAVPKSIHYRCVLHDIFTEIMVMDKFKNDPKIVHLYGSYDLSLIFTTNIFSV